MIISESFIQGKKNCSALCEDAIFISDNFVAVLDGVTSKSTHLFNGKTGGRAAAEAAVTVLSQTDPLTDKETLMLDINNAIAELYKDTPTGEAAVCIAIYSKHYKEIWSVGDCQFIINGKKFSNEKEIDKILSATRALILELCEIRGEDSLSSDPGREFIMPILKKQHLLANGSGIFSYPLLNGGTFNTNKIYSIPVNSGDEVVLATDGYPELRQTLKESEEKLADILRTDPMCCKKFISTKGLEKGCLSFDDRAYVKFVV